MEPLFEFLLRHLAYSLRLSVCLSRLLVSSYRLSIPVSFSTWSPHDFFFFLSGHVLSLRERFPRFHSSLCCSGHSTFGSLFYPSLHVFQVSYEACLRILFFALNLSVVLLLILSISCSWFSLFFFVFFFKSMSFKQLSFHSRSDEAHGLAGNMLDKSMILYRGIAVKLRSKSEKALFKSEVF